MLPVAKKCKYDDTNSINVDPAMNQLVLNDVLVNDKIDTILTNITVLQRDLNDFKIQINTKIIQIDKLIEKFNNIISKVSKQLESSEYNNCDETLNNKHHMSYIS